MTKKLNQQYANKSTLSVPLTNKLKTYSSRRVKRCYTNIKSLNKSENKKNPEKIVKYPYPDKKINIGGFITYRMLEYIFLLLILTFILGIFFMVLQLYHINVSLHKYHVLPQYMFDITRLLEELIARDKELHLRMKVLENHVVVLTEAMVDAHSLDVHITKTFVSTVIIGGIGIALYLFVDAAITPLLDTALTLRL